MLMVLSYGARDVYALDAGSSHNGYLEILGNLAGLFGLGLALVIATLSVWNAFRLLKYREFKEIGNALIMLNAASLI